MRIGVQRIYDPPGADDGFRVLVDRLWPRGLRKADAAIDLWCREVAPSTPLRKWFGHDPARWDAFRTRYAAELDAAPETWQPLLEHARRQPLVLLYAARDTQHNHAVALADYLRAAR